MSLKKQSGGIGARLRAAVESIRREVEDATAELAVITPSAGNGVFARRSLAETGAFVRIRFITPEELVESLALLKLADRELRPEASAWRTATLGIVLEELSNDEELGEQIRLLRGPGWRKTLRGAIDTLERACVSPELLRSIAGEHRPRARLLAAILEKLAAARDREKIYAHAALIEAAHAAVDDPRLPPNRARGVIVIGDRMLGEGRHRVLQKWIAKRAGRRIASLPLESIAPAPFGLRSAAMMLPVEQEAVDASTRLGSLKAHLFASGPKEPAFDETVCLAATPDELREISEGVREVQRAIRSGTPLDRIAVVLPDATSIEIVADKLETARIPATFLIGPPLQRTAEAQLLRLALDVRLGADSVERWYALLRHPALRLRAARAPVRGTGRWRGILASCGAVSGSSFIVSALADWADRQAPLDEAAEKAGEAAHSLRALISELSADLERIPAQGALEQFAAGISAFVTRWIAPSAHRARLLGIFNGWAGPRISLEDAARLLEEALAEIELLDGQLTEPKIRVLPPMALLGAELDLVVFLGFNEGRLPKRAREDVLLGDALVRELAAKGAPLVTSDHVHDQEKRRLAVAIGACRKRLWLSMPETELMTARPLRTSRLLLEVAATIFGRRPTYAGVEQLATRSGSRSLVAPLDPDEAIGRTEHLISRLAHDPLAHLAALASHTTARRLLQLQRSIDRFERAREQNHTFADAWTGLVPPEVLACPLFGGEELSGWALTRAVLEPAAFFFGEMLAARRAPALPEAWEPYSERAITDRVLQVLPLALSDRDLRAAFAREWSRIEVETAKHRPPLAKERIALGAALGARVLEQLIERFPALIEAELVEVPAVRPHGALRFVLRSHTLVDLEGALVEFSRRSPERQKMKLEDGLSLALSAMVLARTGQPFDTLAVHGINKDSCTGTRAALDPLVRAQLEMAVKRARLGFWPMTEDSKLKLAREAGLDVTDLELSSRYVEGLSK